MIKVHFPFLKKERPSDFAAAVVGEAFKSTDLWGRRFNDLYINAPKYFCSVSADEAEIFVYPYRYTLNDETLNAGEEAEKRGLECIFFTHGDDASIPDIPFGRLYRHSIFSDKRGKNEYAMPAFADDILQNLPASITPQMICPREKGVKPIVAFRGYVGNSLLRTAFRFLGKKEKAVGLTLRNKLLKKLSSDGRIVTIFEKQNHFSGGVKGITSSDLNHAEWVKNEYIKNLLSADYTLCVRGAGNFSYRFYEVLAAGRIPLFINTNCVLPFEDEINWRKHCLWIESDEIDQLSGRLVEFHTRTTDDQFSQMQKNNRLLWEEYLSPLGFYRQLLGKLVRQQSKGRD
jgi:hypothetical protein